jgi:hypothetical protein
MKQLPEPQGAIQFHLPLLQLQSAELPPEAQRELVLALAELLLQAASARLPTPSQGDERELEANR